MTPNPSLKLDCLRQPLRSNVMCLSLQAVTLIPLASQGHYISGPCQCRYFYP